MKYILHALVLAVVFSACGDGGSAEGQKRTMPTSNGVYSQILIVMDDDLWEGSLGGLIHNRLAAPYPGLPQDEPMFYMIRVNDRGFTSLLQKTKSILQFKIIPDSTHFYMARNVWAEPQLVAEFIAPDKLALARLFESKRSEVIEKFQEHDAKLLADRLRRHSKATLPSELKKFGITKMLMSQNFEVTLDKDSLVIFRSNNLKTNQVIFFHSRPIDDYALPGDDMIAIRDSILKNYFEGPSDNSYPGTEMRIPPILTQTEIDDQIAFELRGLWRTYGDMMGGPFLSYEIYVEEHNLIVTVDAFMYGPGVDKRNLMMELEVYLRSIRF